MASLTISQLAVNPDDEIPVAVVAVGTLGAVPVAEVVAVMVFELPDVPYVFTALTR